MKSKSLTTTKAGVRKQRRLPPVHPGEMLREEFLLPLGLSASALALALRVPTTRITEIVHERRGITADTALRLSRYLGTSAEFWMNVQHRYELETARDAAEAVIEKSVIPAPRDKKTGALMLAKAA